MRYRVLSLGMAALALFGERVRGGWAGPMEIVAVAVMVAAVVRLARSPLVVAGREEHDESVDSGS